MNIQHLRHFIAVAEELHFGRAAERVGIAQPPLSQSIRRLEDSLGCRLLERSRRHVELTVAGETMLEHARIIINQVDYCRRAVLSASEVGISKVSVGFSRSALSDHIPKAMRAIRAVAPAARIVLAEARGQEQVKSLLSGELDIGFFNARTTAIDGLEVHLIERTPIVAAIPEGWPLATKPNLQIADFAGVPLLLPAASSPRLHEAIMGAFHARGMTPNICQEAVADFTRLKLVAAELGVTWISARAAPDGYPGVVQRPIVDLPEHISLGLYVVWRSDVGPASRKLFTAIHEAVTRGEGEAPRVLQQIKKDDPVGL